MARDTRPYTTPPVAANGTTSVEIRVANGISTWVVDQVSTRMDTAPVGAISSLSLNGTQLTPLIATGDVADGDPAVTLRPADTLIVAWAGCTPGDTATVLIMFDDGSPT